MITAAALALAVLLLGWVGYPLILSAIAARRPELPTGKPHRPVRVSVVVATRDAPAVVAARVANLCNSAYPADALEIIVAVDAACEYPLSAYEPLLMQTARLARGDAPGGKAVTLNAGVRSASGEILVFADSHQRFAPDAIGRMVGFLDCSRFGAVTGGYAPVGGGDASALLNAFWRYEVSLRRAEARVHSVVAVTGAIYAMRRDLWQALPPGLICDDLFIPIGLAVRGARVGFCEAAVATDPRRFSRSQEFQRKVRTLTGMVQFCVWRPSALLPWRNPVWLQFVCHKLIRLATPYCLVAAVFGFAILVSRMPLQLLVPLVIGAMFLAVAATLLRPRRARTIASQVVWGVWLQAAPVLACLNGARGRWDVWHKQ